MVRMTMLCAVILLTVTVAVADVAMDPAPAIQVTWTPAVAGPEEPFDLPYEGQCEFEYTVTDQDTFTPGPPPPPQPPYTGASLHDDDVRLYSWTHTQSFPDVFQCTIGPDDEWWGSPKTYTISLTNLNWTGNPQMGNYSASWDDRGLQPQMVPPAQRTGTATDTGMVLISKDIGLLRE